MKENLDKKISNSESELTSEKSRQDFNGQLITTADLIEGKVPPETINQQSEIIRSLTDNEFINLLLNFGNYTFRDKLDQDVVEIIMDKGFELAQKMSEQEKNQPPSNQSMIDSRFVLSMLNSALTNQYRGNEPVGTKISDKGLLTFHKLYPRYNKKIFRNYENIADTYWQSYMQTGWQTTNRHLLLKVIKDMYSDEEVTDGWRGTTGFSLVEAMMYDSTLVDDLRAVIRKDEKVKYYDYIKWLKFWKDMQIYSLNFDEGGNAAMYQLYEAFQKELSDPEFNLIINNYIRNLAERRYNYSEPHEEDLSPDYSGMYNDRNELVGLKLKENKEIVELQQALALRNTAKLNESERKKNSEAVMDFRMFADSEFRNFINQHFGVNLNEFDIRVQMRFINAIKNASNEELSAIQALLQKHGQDKLLLFLGGEYGEDFTEVILRLNKEFDPKIVKPVFDSFAKTVGSISTQDSELSKQFFYNQLAISPAGALVDRAQRRLRTYLKRMQTKNVDKESKKILVELESINHDVELFSAVCKSALLEGRATLADIKGVDIKRNQKPNPQEVLEFVKKRYKNTIMLNTVIQNADRLLRKENKVRFYEMRRGEELLSTIAFEDLDDNTTMGQLYILDPAYDQSALASFFSQEILKKEASQSTVIAKTRKDNPALKHFISKSGWIQIGEEKATDAGSDYVILQYSPQAEQSAAA